MPSPATTTVDRRHLLRGLGCLGVAATTAAVAPRAAFATSRSAATGNTVVVLWLRGGMDALSVVMPMDDADYVDARRQIAVTSDAGLPLDDRFGLHPAMAPLLDWYRSGDLGIVHAIGNPLPTRSHFTAMDELERGTPGSFERQDGWLARWLASAAATSGSPFRAVGVGRMLPASLRGHGPALAIASIEGFTVDAPTTDQEQMLSALAALHEAEDDPLAQEGRRALDAVTALAASGASRAAGRDGYPDSPLGRSLAEVVALVRADIGLEVATVDGGGWDTHTAMGTPDRGTMREQVADLAQALAAFAEDLASDGLLERVTLVTMSEFGRRVQSNSSGGTDHGRATASFVLGGGVSGGSVHGDWPGLAPDELVPVGGAGDPRGDLAVTTDWRDLLSEVLTSRLRAADLGEVFPGYAPTSLGVMTSS